MYKSIALEGKLKNPRVVVGVFAEQDSLPRSLNKLPLLDRDALTEAISTPGFKADLGEAIPVGEGHLLVGLGKTDSLTTSRLRTLGGKLVRTLSRMEIDEVVLTLALSVPGKVAKPDRAAQCIAEGMVIGNWKVNFFDGKATRKTEPKQSLAIKPFDPKLKKALQRGLTLGECTNYTRQLAATPPNICNPTWMAAEARRLAKETGLSCKIISYAQAQKLGMGGIVNVGKGSISKPCLIILEHKPPRAKKEVTLALVGKTITYDTGGYSLKISNGMKGMKYDKNGGMAVLGAMRAIAMLKLKTHVVGLLPCAENMVNEEAYRPDDIITMYNGVTVEVTNTDAEGRLVLADALAYACDKYTPTAILDAATLTGGVVVALGSFCAGLWCEDNSLRKRLEKASGATDEKLWRLPLWEAHRDFMRAKHADLWNSGPARDAHPIQGAAFLSFFVDENVPWAHLDIAGVSDVESDKDIYVTGPTGYGVRLLTEVAESFNA
jgi:leucyl aminopeptidase